MREITVPNIKNTTVLINGVSVPGVKLVKTYEDREFYYVKELLMGTTGYIDGENSYRILLVLGLETELQLGSNFTLVIKTPEYVSTYSGCRITNVNELVKAPNIYDLEYSIKASKKTTV